MITIICGNDREFELLDSRTKHIASFIFIREGYGYRAWKNRWNGDQTTVYTPQQVANFSRHGRPHENSDN